MYVTAISLLGDREQAADAVQRAFVQAWRAADGFDPNRELKPWLYAIGSVKSRTSRAQRRLAALLPHLRETARAVAS